MNIENPTGLLNRLTHVPLPPQFDRLCPTKFWRRFQWDKKRTRVDYA